MGFSVCDPTVVSWVCLKIAGTNLNALTQFLVFVANLLLFQVKPMISSSCCRRTRYCLTTMHSTRRSAPWPIWPYQQPVGSQAKLLELADRGHSQAVMPKWATRGHSRTEGTRGRTLPKFTKSAWELPCQAAQICHQEVDLCLNNDLIKFIGLG